MAGDDTKVYGCTLKIYMREQPNQTSNIPSLPSRLRIFVYHDERVFHQGDPFSWTLIVTSQSGTNICDPSLKILENYGFLVPLQYVPDSAYALILQGSDLTGKGILSYLGWNCPILILIVFESLLDDEFFSSHVSRYSIATSTENVQTSSNLCN